MPPKKPIKRNNKKKKDKSNGGTLGAATAKSAAATKTTSPFAGLTLADIQNKEREMKEFGGTPHLLDDSSATNTDDRASTVGGIYGLYKQATQRFKEGLLALVPEQIFAMDRVQALMDAVDYLVEQHESIDPVLLVDCRTSLQFRKKYSKQFEGGGDLGHGYFILVLNYCYQCLKKLVPRTERKAAAAAAVNNEASKRFQFTDLQVESDDDDVDADAEDEKPAATRIPQRPSGPEQEFTVEDLIESTDRFKACIFLSDVDNTMCVVANTYKATKSNMFSPETEAPYLMGSLVMIGAITNLAIREVILLEAELKVECPHLDTFYRVLACVFLSEFIDDFADTVRDAGKSIPRPELTKLVGDVVELCFRFPSSFSDHLEPMINEFLDKWTLPRGNIAKSIEALSIRIRAESMLSVLLKDPEVTEKMKSQGIEFHTWMDDLRYIGGDRSIINTQLLLQMQATSLMKGGVEVKLVYPKGLFGDMWDEEENLAQNIRGDMDQLLMEDILPELLFNCQYGPLSLQMDAGFQELLPLFVLLKDYAANPHKPTKLALTFGIHAILTSILEVQGNKDFATIAKFCKDSHNLYFGQVEALLKTKLANSAIWKHLVEGIIWRKFLSTPFFDPVNDRSEDRAFWNPCCAGMFLGYLEYFMNFVCGACLTDYFQQLRLTLHLHHALRLRNLVADNMQPLLIYLDRYFRGVPSIWQGGKPARDNIVKKFLIINGRPLNAIGLLYENCKSFVLQQPMPPPRRNFNASSARSVKRRKKDQVKPEGFLKTYRNIYEIEDRKKQSATTSTTPQENNNNNNDNEVWNSDFVRRAKDVMNKVMKEQPMFSLNMAAASGCCDTFLRILVDRMKWRPILNRVVESKPSCLRASCPLQKQRIALCEVIHLFLLGPLELIDDIERHSTVIAARDCLEEYFDGLDPSEYEFLKAVAEDNDEVHDGRALEDPVACMTNAFQDCQM